MEVLSSPLNTAPRVGFVKYHPSCSRVHLTHLCLADDFMAFFGGDADSLGEIIKIINYFRAISGVKVTPAKTEVFLAGYTEEQVAEIFTYLWFRERKISC